MYNILQQILQLPKSLSYPFLERKREIPSSRDPNMRKRNVLRLCHLRVLRCRGWLLSVAPVSLRSARGKNYLCPSATPIKASTDASSRGANMRKRNVLRLCHLRVLRGKKYRFSSATPIKASTDDSSRGANMRKSNVLRLCRLRVLRCRGWLLSVAPVSLRSARGKKYRFSSATPIEASTDDSSRGVWLLTYITATRYVFTTFVSFVSFVVKKSVKIRTNSSHLCAPAAFGINIILTFSKYAGIFCVEFYNSFQAGLMVSIPRSRPDHHKERQQK